MTASMWVVMAAAVLASLAAGVLLAHGVCVAMFRAFRIHARQVSAQRQISAKPVVATLP